MSNKIITQVDGERTRYFKREDRKPKKDEWGLVHWPLFLSGKWTHAGTVARANRDHDLAKCTQGDCDFECAVTEILPPPVPAGWRLTGEFRRWNLDEHYLGTDGQVYTAVILPTSPDPYGLGWHRWIVEREVQPTAVVGSEVDPTILAEHAAWMAQRQAIRSERDKARELLERHRKYWDRFSDEQLTSQERVLRYDTIAFLHPAPEKEPQGRRRKGWRERTYLPNQCRHCGFATWNHHGKCIGGKEAERRSGNDRREDHWHRALWAIYRDGTFLDGLRLGYQAGKAAR